MRAPFPWFGGKAHIAGEVWRRLGDCPNYVEPFFGSGAALLARPASHRWCERTETVNDADGFVSNFWRAVRADPEAVARWADWPVNECDLHARHAWLVGQRESVTARLEGDPDWCDAKVAGWWVWGICAWIGSGWCIDNGPWQVVDGELVNTNGGRRGINRQLPHLGNGQGINRQLPHLGGGRGINRQLPHLGGGRGINRQLPHLGDAGRGINRQLPHLGDAGRGINRQLPHLGSTGQGQCAAWSGHLAETMAALADRLRRVRVCCGDWSRVVGETPTIKHGTTAMFLDPPYAFAERAGDLYAHDTDVAAEVRRWAIAHGDDPRYRIALCGYEGEHAMPEDWMALRWKARGGYGSQGNGRGADNAHRETVWFSPHCLAATRQPALFDAGEGGRS